MKFEVTIIFDSIFRPGKQVPYTLTFYTAHTAVREVREWQEKQAKDPKRTRMVSYKITPIKKG